MKDKTDIHPLAGWDRSDPAEPESMALMVAQPGFPAASRALAVNMLQAYAGDKAVAGIFKDAGRYVAAMWAIYLHVTGGLTLPSLKALCASSGLLSPGRARALLLYLRYLGYVEPAPKPPRGQPARYLPTQSFITAWRRHLIAALEAAAIAEPALDPFMNRLCEPDALDILTRIQSEGLHDAVKLHADLINTPLYTAFVNRHAGSQILWRLIADSDGQVFPPRRVQGLSAAALARSFQVSRIHVRRVMDDAESQGLIRRDGDGAILFTAEAQEALTIHCGVQLLSLLRATSQTLQELTQKTLAPA